MSSEGQEALRAVMARIEEIKQYVTTLEREKGEMKQQLAALTKRAEEEKSRRVYYQDIVYHVCNAIDKIRGARIICGTVETPTQQVQDAMTHLVQERWVYTTFMDAAVKWYRGQLTDRELESCIFPYVNKVQE